MKANEFIKKFGLDDAKNIVCGWIRRDFDDSYHIAEGIYCNLPFEPTDDCGTLSLFDLKRIVESHELVALFDDIDCAKAWVSDLDSDWPYQVKGADTKFFKWQLEQAILDVESCQ